jgi:hypothetical protein
MGGWDLLEYQQVQFRPHTTNGRTDLSNSREHWFWNYERADQRDTYRIDALQSPHRCEAPCLLPPTNAAQGWFMCM